MKQIIRQLLNDLEHKLKEVKHQATRSCNQDLNENIQKLFSGAYQLEAMHHDADDLRNEVIDLHSRYLNTCFELFGFYPGSEVKE